MQPPNPDSETGPTNRTPNPDPNRTPTTDSETGSATDSHVRTYERTEKLLTDSESSYGRNRANTPPKTRDTTPEDDTWHRCYCVVVFGNGDLNACPNLAPPDAPFCERCETRHPAASPESVHVGTRTVP